MISCMLPIYQSEDEYPTGTILWYESSWYKSRARGYDSIELVRIDGYRFQSHLHG